jgi:uncharacterized membrane protein
MEMRAAEAAAPAAGQPGRLPVVDVARSLALCGMVVFHAVVDLELFGVLPPGTTFSGLWPGFARLVAGSFLFVAGVSLWLAHGCGIRWRAFLRRLGVLVLAAGGVSLATWLAMPDRFVHFGILHSIAAASVIGLAVLRLPAGATLAVAAAILVAPEILGGPAFDRPWLWWLGLSPSVPPSMDFEPVLPWAAPFLAGLALARLADRAGLLARLARPGPWPPALGLLAWPGRHSLAIYLLHQPVLLAAIWAALRLAGGGG